MTIVVAFLCTDGVVVASDSKVSLGDGSPDLPSHPGKKIYILGGEQIFAFSGPLDLATRFRFIANQALTEKDATADWMDYHRLLSDRALKEFQSTRLIHPTDRALDIDLGLDTVLVYVHGDAHHCCSFDGAMQPQPLDEYNFYVSLGSGCASAELFLHFLVGVFCCDQDGPSHRHKPRQPNVRQGIFLATWTIDHVIQTNVGGVGYPIQIATLERDDQNRDDQNNFITRILTTPQITEHSDTIDNARNELRAWRNRIPTRDQNTPQPPERRER